MKVAETTSQVDGQWVEATLYRLDSNDPSHNLVLRTWDDWGPGISAQVTINGQPMGTYQLPSPDRGPGWETPRIKFTAGQSPVRVKINGTTVLTSAVDSPGSQTDFDSETGTQPYTPAEGGNYQAWAESEAEDAAEAALADRAGATIEDEVLADARAAAQDDIADLPTAGEGDAPTQSELRDVLEDATADARDVAEQANDQLPSGGGLGLGAMGAIAAVGVAALTLVINA